jgi:hypothetical protein
MLRWSSFDAASFPSYVDGWHPVEGASLADHRKISQKLMDSLDQHLLCNVPSQSPSIAVWVLLLLTPYACNSAMRCCDFAAALPFLCATIHTVMCENASEFMREQALTIKVLLDTCMHCRKLIPLASVHEATLLALPSISCDGTTSDGSSLLYSNKRFSTIDNHVS